METEKRKKVAFSFVFPVERCLFSPRIFLRRFSRSHAEEYLELVEKNRFWLLPWMPESSKPPLLADIQRSIEFEHQESKRSQRLDMGIFRRSDGAILGRISLHSVHWGVSFSAGLGYWIDLENSGMGLMTEAVSTILAACFEDANFHRVWAGVQPLNQASRKVLEKLGFVREGLHRKELFINGKWQDQYCFSLLDEEYRQLVGTWRKKGWLEL